MNDMQVRKVVDLQEEGVLLVEDGNHGEYRPRRDEFVDAGTAFIRAADMDQGRVLFETASQINDVALARIRKGIGAGGDVLLSHKGTVGKVAYAPLDSPPFVCSPQTTFWRTLDTDRLDRKYLYAYMRSPHFHAQLRSRQNETDMAAYVSLTAQRQLEVLLPEIGAQRAIAEILGSLDDKIELNRRMNRVLEGMARAIFKAWFIDFDPVKAKAAGATRFPGMPQHVFEQLPNQLVDSELGEIPEGWEVVPFSDLIDLIGGGTPRRKIAEYWDGDIPWFSVKDAPAKQDIWVIDTEEHITRAGVENSSAKIMRERTTLISARGTVGRLALTAVPMAMNQSCYGIQGKDGIGDFFVFFTIQNAVEDLQQRVHGSVFDTITRRTFDLLVQVRPQTDLIDAFEEAVAPFLDLMKTNLFESRVLSNTRNTLLPKLISGELRVCQ